MTRSELTNYTMTHDTDSDGFTLCLDFTEFTHWHEPDGPVRRGTECLTCTATITEAYGPATDTTIEWSI